MNAQAARWVTVVENDGCTGRASSAFGSVHAMATGCAQTLCALAVEVGTGLKPLPAVEFAVFVEAAPKTTCPDCRRAFLRAG